MGRPERTLATLAAALMLLAALCAGAHEAAAQSDTQAVEPARAAIRLKDYRVAVEHLQPLATRGDRHAQYLLGSLYRVGLGVPVDVAKARELLVAAAQGKHAAAAYSLAMLLTHEEPRDPAQAGVWLKRASDYGHPLALASVQRGALPLQFLPQKDLTAPDALRAALWLAAQHDDAQLAAVLADADMLKHTDDFGRGVLSVAAQSGAARTVSMLLERGASPNQADSFGITPLMLAARSANEAVLDALLRAKAPLDAIDRVGNSALMYAAAAGHDTALARLLHAGASAALLNAQGWSALDWAVASQSSRAADLLRKQGLSTRRTPQRIAGSPQAPLQRAANPAVDLYRGMADVQVAASRSSPTLLKAVIDHERAAGKAPRLPDSALMSAVITGSPSTIDAMLAAGAQVTPTRSAELLRWLLMRGDQDALATLLAHRRDVPAGSEALLIAVTAQRVDAVKALLNAHADTEVRDSAGRTPLILAAASGQLDIARELLAHLARSDSVDKAGRTALWYASGAGASEIVAALLAAGSQVDGADTQGFTPLAIASAKGHAAVADMLLRAGANAKARTRNESTPLMLAAQGGHTAVVSRLLNAGVNVDDQNRYGDTALIVAVRAEKIATVRQLLASGASGNLRNADRVSALDVASALALTEIAALLQRG